MARRKTVVFNVHYHPDEAAFVREQAAKTGFSATTVLRLILRQFMNEAKNRATPEVKKKLEGDRV